MKYSDEILKKYSPLKLRAEDDNDLEVLSECLFESIFIKTEMSFLEKDKIFFMSIDRFTWEISGLSPENLLQVQCILQVDNVNSIYADGLFDKNDSLYSLISIVYSDNYLTFSFDKGAILTLETKQLRVFMEDIGKPMLPATVPLRKSGMSL